MKWNNDKNNDQKYPLITIIIIIDNDNALIIVGNVGDSPVLSPMNSLAYLFNPTSQWSESNI